MFEKLIYKPLDNYSNDEIKEILGGNDLEKIICLPLTIGEYHSDWKYAQNLCIKLSNHEDPRVRANAVLGLAYIARNHRKLDKRIVKPVILRELRENEEYKWRIIDAIEDINIFLKWNLGLSTAN